MVTSLAVFVINPRYCYSLGIIVVVGVQKLWHFVIQYLCHYWRYLLETRNMCSLSKDQSLLSRETIQTAFFSDLCPFFDFNFLFSIKHPTAKHFHPHAMLVSFLAHLSTTCSRGAFRVVRCPLCVVNNFFKHLLLQNRWANLDQTWQECSFGGPLQKLFTEFDSIKNSGCLGNKIQFFKQFFKNLLLWNRWSDFEIISQECSLGDPFQKLAAKFWSAQKHGSGEWGLCAL